MENWETVKEDIIPCRRGRDVTTVVEAVFRQNDPIYHRERLSKINYMDWLNDSYAYVGNTKYLESILVRAIREVSKSESIKDDHRFISWWLKLIKFCQNSIPIFRLLFDNGIGTMNSYFFIAWVDAYLEEAMQPNISPIKVLSHWKQVSLLLAHAIRAGSEPKPPIHHRAKSFQLAYQKYFKMLEEKHPEHYKKAVAYLAKNPTDSLFVIASNEVKTPGLVTHDKFGLPDLQKNFHIQKSQFDQKKQKNMKLSIFQDPSGDSSTAPVKPKSDLTKIHLLKTKPSAQTKEDQPVVEKVIQPCINDIAEAEKNPSEKKEKKQAFLIYQDEPTGESAMKDAPSSVGDETPKLREVSEGQNDTKKGITSDDMMKFIENINKSQTTSAIDEFPSVSNFYKINFPSIPFPWNEEYPDSIPFASLRLIYGGLCEKNFEEFRISHYQVKKQVKILTESNGNTAKSTGTFKTTYNGKEDSGRIRSVSLSEYTTLPEDEVYHLAYSLEDFAKGKLFTLDK